MPARLKRGRDEFEEDGDDNNAYAPYRQQSSSSSTTRSSKRQKTNKAVVFDAPFRCAFMDTGCEFRSTCSYHHGAAYNCDCDDPWCNAGHPHRRRPKACDHGDVDSCRWNLMGECSFHHGTPTPCTCTSTRCPRAHAHRIRKVVLEEKVLFPRSLAGKLIGIGGQNIREIKAASGCLSVIVEKEGAGAGAATAMATATTAAAGSVLPADVTVAVTAKTQEAMDHAKRLIEMVRIRAEAASAAGNGDEAKEKAVERVVSIPGSLVGHLIGKAGAQIKALEALSGCVMRTRAERGKDGVTTVTAGNLATVQLGVELINERLKTCQVCNQVFPTVQSHLSHRAKKTHRKRVKKKNTQARAGQERATGSGAASTTTTTTRFRCPHCSTEVASWNVLLAHVKAGHGKAKRKAMRGKMRKCKVVRRDTGIPGAASSSSSSSSRAGYVAVPPPVSMLSSYSIAQRAGEDEYSYGGHISSEEDDYNSDAGGGMGLVESCMGFSGGEVYELACQGVKPWDDDAGAVLAALSSY